MVGRGTTIKDTWTKSSGMVEVGDGAGFGCGGAEGWGDNAKTVIE